LVRLASAFSLSAADTTGDAIKLDKDGHFVAFDVPSANADVVRFLAAGVGATPPPIGN
jgi:hypothetical protein